MKKNLFNLLLFLSTAHAGFAQKNTSNGPYHTSTMNKMRAYIYFDGYSYNPVTKITTEVTQGVMNTRIFDILDKEMNNPPNLEAWIKAHPGDHSAHFTPKEPLLLGIRYKSDTTDFPSYRIATLSKKYSGRLVPDDTDIELLAMGINAENVKDYRYRIVENDSILISDWKIPQLQQKHGAKEPYAFFGEFKERRKQLMIEVKNIKNYNLGDGMIITWGTANKPEINDILFNLRSKPSTFLNLKVAESNRGYANKFDQKTGLPLDFRFPLDSVAQINLSFKNNTVVPFDICLVTTREDGLKDTSMIAYKETHDIFSMTNQYLYPGKKEIIIYPTGTRDPKHSTKFSFEVTQTKTALAAYSLKQLIPYVLLLILLFSIYYVYNRRKLRKIGQQKKMANLQLNGLRAQLNPHFMFNALTSIQNLVNQNDNKGANHYLTKFAQLTRQVLKATGQELISLEDEVELLTNYLEMEKLRFGFDYSINFNPEINLANMQIPSMLLQPFVENAAKHGVSAMKTGGEIKVGIDKEASDLLLSISDNGQGFDETATAESSGVGLKLSRERIRLLNEIYNEQKIELNVNSTTSGITIQVRLKNWL
ncbi:sensor histidine kinase [Pedobacter sp. MC2016-24]|uniref:sensor histidine kinase n=1 Tax=Pedobacter sp. MC2016-24 TaxID=2780090 RepID=UPI00188213A4|nr:histidine kinase [Pedobacter sp. MC2016-24]MBE9602968.1 histidine kinase [Pedobacter sp. MC2016-24]